MTTCKMQVGFFRIKVLKLFKLFKVLILLINKIFDNHVRICYMEHVNPGPASATGMRPGYSNPAHNRGKL